MEFFKYQGTGNDFILVDQRYRHYIKRNESTRIAHLCDRRFGIGGDGLILLQRHPDFDFEMIYFNADGYESSMCGNGGRCIVAFAQYLGWIKGTCSFLAIDGPHEAIVKASPKKAEAWVELKMADVPSFEVTAANDFVLDTGSPHFVRFTNDIQTCDIVKIGRSIRYGERFVTDGINVNLVEAQTKGIAVLTYERGVEDETLSCGTGVTAAALAHHFYQNKGKKGAFETKIKAKGGDLAVRFEVIAKNKIQNIWLCAPAVQVFKGKINL